MTARPAVINPTTSIPDATTLMSRGHFRHLPVSGDAEGISNAGAAQTLGVAVKSVSKWRRQFADQRLAGLEDAAPVGWR